MRAHPRSRGEHHDYDSLIFCPSGSSPLARGTRFNTWREMGYTGLIPARAGNTLTFPEEGPAAWAHPRSRGEHAKNSHTETPQLGSSPLARGTHLLTWDFTPYISKIESLWSQSLTPEYTISSHY